MYFDSVYYSHFWYSRFVGVSLRDIDGDFLNAEVDNHKWNIRLLSLFFRHIYIPRTHLITQASELQAAIASRLFQSDDFRFLVETGTLQISTFPGLDGTEDSERIASRARETTDISYARSPDFIRQIPATERMIVASNKEAQSNSITFPDYARNFLVYDPAITNSLIEIMSRSTLTTVPFFHESFVRRIRDGLPPHMFKKIWRDTNSIYLTSAAPVQSGTIPYFNPEIESISFRYVPHKVDRYLFNPAALYTFMTVFLTDKELAKFSFGPIQQSFKCLLNETASRVVSDFREEYFELAEMISNFTRHTPASKSLNVDDIRKRLLSIFDNRFDTHLDALERLITSGKVVATSAHSPPVAAALALLSPAIRLARPGFDRIFVRRRFPKLMRFVAELKDDLSRVSRDD